jgi:hypothetical protein
MSCLFPSADLADEVDEASKVDANTPFDDRSYYVKWTRDEKHRAGGWFEVSDQLSGKKIKLTQERAVSVQTGKFIHANAIFLPDNPTDYPFDHYFATGTLMAWAAGTRNGLHPINVRHRRHECKDEGGETTAVVSVQSPWIAQLESGSGGEAASGGKAKALCAWFSPSMNIDAFMSPVPKIVIFNDPYVYAKEKLNNECLRCTHCNTNVKLEPAIRYPFTFPHYAPDSLNTIIALIDSIQSHYRHKNEIAKAAAARFGGKRMFKDTKAKVPMSAVQLLKMLETSFASTHSFYWYNFIAHALGDVSEHKRYQSTQYYAYDRKQPTSLDLAKLDEYIARASAADPRPALWLDANVGKVLTLLREFCTTDKPEQRETIQNGLLPYYRGNEAFPTRNALSMVDESPIAFYLGHKLSAYKVDKPSEKLTYGTQVVLTMMSCVDLAYYITVNQNNISPSERELIEEFVKGVSTMVASDLTKCPGHCALLSIIQHFYGDRMDKPDSFWKAFSIVRSKPWSIKTWKSMKVTQQQISKTDLACFMLSAAPIETHIADFGAPAVGGADMPSAPTKKRMRGIDYCDVEKINIQNPPFDFRHDYVWRL